MQENTISVGDRVLPVPQLSLDDLETYANELDTIARNDTDNPNQHWPKLHLMAKIISEVIHNAYPDVPIPDIRKAIPIRQAYKIFSVLLGTDDPKSEPQQPSAS